MKSYIDEAFEEIATKSKRYVELKKIVKVALVMTIFIAAMGALAKGSELGMPWLAFIGLAVIIIMSSVLFVKLFGEIGKL